MGIHKSEPDIYSILDSFAVQSLAEAMEGGSCKVYLLVMEAVAVRGMLHYRAAQKLHNCKLLSVPAAKMFV
jgi:hypothetical protein